METINPGDVIKTTKGQRLSGKGGWLMQVIEIQHDIEGDAIIYGKRKLKSGGLGVDFVAKTYQVEIRGLHLSLK